MIDDSVPNFPETSPQDYDSQDNEENEIDDIQEVPEQQPEEIPNNINNINQTNNIPYQNSINNQIQNNNIDDVLLRSSMDIFDSSNPTYSTQILSNNAEQMEPIVAQPIYQNISNPQIQNIGGIQNTNIGGGEVYSEEINTDINNNINSQVEVNSPMLESEYFNQYNNNTNNNIEISNKQFATVKPISSTNNNLDYINNNNNLSNIQYNEGINQQYIPEEQNIIYSTPLPQRTNYMNNTTNINHNNNINYTAPFTQSMPVISPTSYVTKLNSPNYLKNDNENININNINNINTGMNNLNLSNSKNEVTIKLTGKNPKINTNINKSKFLKSKPLKNNSKNIKEFSPDSWTLFYSENDPFFNSLDFQDSIPNQKIENPSKNEAYIGQINNLRQKHGFGKLLSPLYERIGTWVNDRFHGWGRETRKNGDIFEGKFVNDILEGKGKYKSGNILYLGDFDNYNKHGKGELFTDQYHYVGEFVNNRFHGKGRIEIYEKGVYEGDFDKDDITGYGIFKYDDGKFYEGKFVEGKRQGYGKLTTSEGKIYEGNFYNDEYQGNSGNNNFLRNKKSPFRSKKKI